MNLYLKQDPTFPKGLLKISGSTRYAHYNLTISLSPVLQIKFIYDILHKMMAPDFQVYTIVSDERHIKLDSSTTHAIRKDEKKRELKNVPLSGDLF